MTVITDEVIAEGLRYAQSGCNEYAAAAKRHYADALREVRRLREENTRLRAALAVSKDPCVYCQLPAAEMARCESGFPGCARADDMSGCPEFGACIERDEWRALAARLAAALKEYADWQAGLGRPRPLQDMTRDAYTALADAREAGIT